MNDLRILRYGISLWIVLALCVCGQAAEQEELPDQMSKVSYGIGMNLGRQWRQQEIPINIDLLMRGLRDSMGGNPTLMTEEEMQTTLMSYQTQHRARMEEKRKQKAKENLEAGEKFLAENKTKTGVVTLPSGLQYKIINEGQGDSPKAHDQVTVHYRGTLIDGTEFELTYAHLSKFSVKDGQKVVAGQKIGEVGSTGCSTGPHLHLGVKVDGVAKLFFPRDLLGSASY